MNIIILQDRKGFQKTVIVPVFPPTYDIVEYPVFEVRPLGELENDPNSAMPKKLTFYPKGDPEKAHGAEILLYKQL